MKIVVLEAASLGKGISLERLKQFGEVVVYDTTTLENIGERIRDADVLMINKIKMNARSLKTAEQLKLITITATGVDGIDLDYCRAHQIRVANMKGYSTNSVAQHTFALLLYVMEKMAYYDQFVKSGAYIRDTTGSYYDMKYTEIAGKTWGIVGLGAIGQKVAQTAVGFGAKVIYCSLSGHNTEQPYQCVDFETLLQEADIISVHTPLTDLSRNLFTYETFQKMKRSAIFINVSRGAVVDEMGLTRALEENLIAAAGLDVLSKEPMAEDNPLFAIQDSTKLVITPHIGWASQESRQRSVQETEYNIEAFLKGEPRNLCC
ncbi:MAG: NAD(P)-dependent oxidoreductase [Lachnospiraceae bacterium]|nr:NAD(P)-dependent oxidoreductase [Lachnospiraceae bacterium]